MSNATAFRSSFKDTNRISISENNLHQNNEETPLNENEKNQEKLETMRVRKTALEETINKKLNELRQICLREGELTGILPKEYPLKENEQAPTIKRRVKTAFTLSDKLLMQPKTENEEKLNKLELEFEIQCKIVKALNKLSNQIDIPKNIRKQRSKYFQQALTKLRYIEKNLQSTKKSIDEEEQSKRMKRKNSIRYVNSNEHLNKNDQLNDNENNILISANKPTTVDLFQKDLNSLIQSAPGTPVKLRNKNFINTDHQDQQLTNPRIDNLIKQRYNNNSPEYDTISSSSLGSANNVFLNNYCKLNNKKFVTSEFNNYEELIENSPETEAKKLFGVPNRRSAIAPNLSQDDSNILIKKQQNDLFYPSLDKYTNERLRSLTRHNSLDKFKQQEALRGLENLENNLRTTSINTQGLSSTNLLSPNLLQANQFNFGSLTSNTFNQNQKSNNLINKSQNNINMAQRPLPSPPVEHKKQLDNNQALNNKKHQLINKPPPLNLNPSPDNCLLNNKTSYSSLIKTNPVRSPTTASMFLQSPLDFEKAIYLNNRCKENDISLIQNNRLDQRDTIVRATPATLTINCQNELNQNQIQKHSPVPILPPRTPITSKPPPPASNFLNSLNPNSINSISSLNLNSTNLNTYQKMSNCSKNMISSNPNLNYTGTKITNNTNKINEKKKVWTETSIDTFKLPNNKFIPNGNCYLLNHDNQPNHLNSINKYQQFTKEKENQLLNMNSSPQSRSSNYSNTISVNNFNNQFLNNDSRSSLNSNSISSNSSSILSSNPSSSALNSTSSQIFQPFVEEIKPYELSDFYKYSQKYKNQQKNLQQQNLNKDQEIHNRHLVNQINNNQLDSTFIQDKNESNEQMSMTMMEESFIQKNQVAKEFSNELKDWLKEKYSSNKAATLV